jgi:peptidoglycan hydrolase-like protein with peptidoglycan-binding domain
MHRTSALVGALALTLAATACQSGADRLAAAGRHSPAPVVVTTPSATATPTATVSPTASPTPSTSPTARPKPKPPAYDVKAVQRTLRTLRYFVGVVDGDRDAGFRSAVMAFQKVNGLGADGVVGPKTLAALKHPVAPKLKGSGSGTRVEVDLTRQVLYLVKGGVVARILPVSSGSGARYRTKSGALATALTPVGYYTIERRIVGERHADLGTLYDPQYFYRGWAIHGSNSVPAYPASHGCVRVTRSDATYLLRQIEVGTRVYLYGGSHVFPAGSAAPGTDDPGGDTAEAPVPTPSPTRSPSPSPGPSASPTPSPDPSPTETASPTPSPVPLPG